MKSTLKWLAILLVILARWTVGSEVKRPKILGVAHMAFYVSDLQKTRAFYKDLLGFEEPFTLKGKDGADRIAFIKVNDYQYIELFAEPAKDDGKLNHIAFYTDDAHRMREYLASRSVAVPDKVGKGQTGNFNYTIKDADGHTVEIVEYQPGSWTAREKGKRMPEGRISAHIAHVGVLVGSLAPAMKFYRDTLGFGEFWRGSRSGRVLDWVNMRVPDGDDYLELMLYTKLPPPEKRGGKNHLCLMVPDVEKAVATIDARPARKNYDKPIEVRVGVNRRRQANLFDPDGTRIELMEPKTIDGKPAPSSTAPAPTSE
jgi:catechol 2,3-dioxygenase-like lactoylglutathione lyase family enzyme